MKSQKESVILSTLCIINWAASPGKAKDTWPGPRPHGSETLMGETSTGVEANKNNTVTDLISARKEVTEKWVKGDQRWVERGGE